MGFNCRGFVRFWVGAVSEFMCDETDQGIEEVGVHLKYSLDITREPGFEETLLQSARPELNDKEGICSSLRDFLVSWSSKKQAEFRWRGQGQCTGSSGRKSRRFGSRALNLDRKSEVCSALITTWQWHQKRSTFPICSGLCKPTASLHSSVPSFSSGNLSEPGFPTSKRHAETAIDTPDLQLEAWSSKPGTERTPTVGDPD